MSRASTPPVFNEGTLIPVSLLFVIASLVFWSATIYQRVLANESAIADVITERQINSDQIEDIRAGVARLEGKMDVMMSRQRRY